LKRFILVIGIFGLLSDLAYCPPANRPRPLTEDEIASIRRMSSQGIGVNNLEEKLNGSNPDIVRRVIMYVTHAYKGSSKVAYALAERLKQKRYRADVERFLISEFLASGLATWATGSEIDLIRRLARLCGSSEETATRLSAARVLIAGSLSPRFRKELLTVPEVAVAAAGLMDEGDKNLVDVGLDLLLCVPSIANYGPIILQRPEDGANNARLLKRLLDTVGNDFRLVELYQGILTSPVPELRRVGRETLLANLKAVQTLQLQWLLQAHATAETESAADLNLTLLGLAAKFEVARKYLVGQGFIAGDWTPDCPTHVAGN